MRHKVDHKRLGRGSSARKALLMNLARALIIHERIETTLPKAKEAQRFVEKLIGKAMDPNVNNVRNVIKSISDKKVVKRLFYEIAPKLKERNGGYTRIYKLSTPRKGDNAPMAILMMSYIGAKEEVTEENKKAPKVVYKAKKETKKAASKKETAKKPVAKKAAPKKPAAKKAAPKKTEAKKKDK
ncbi:50S ribosomal protein L17 [bacterium]|nr:50S ribosomal protein L17 [bacterium]